jgi:hypothetical protein
LSIPGKYCKKIPPFLSFNNFVHLFPVPHEWKQLIENNSYFIYAPAVFAAAGSIFSEIFDSYTGTVKVQEAMGPDSRESNIMKKCAIIDGCPFFNDQLPRIHTAKEREDMKRKFCCGGSSQCARFIVAKALGLEEVPANLFPEDLFRVSTILGMP